MEEVENARLIASHFTHHPRQPWDPDVAHMAKALVQLADAIQKLETRIQRQAEQIAQLQVLQARE